MDLDETFTEAFNSSDSTMNIELLSLKNCEIDLKRIFRHKIDKLPELSHREFSSSTFKLLCEG